MAKPVSFISLQVRPRGKPINRLPEEIALDPSLKGKELYEQIAKQAKFSVHRLRITKGSDGSLVPSAVNVTVHETGLRDQSTIYVKDLGPQIAWRTVFIIEYLGPIIFHPLIYLARPYIYSNPSRVQSFPAASYLQDLFLCMVIGHFVKRELETLLVHRFSLATMPAFNIFKNSAHYWLFAGINLAYWTYSPTSPAARTANPIITYLAIAFFAIGELGNLSAHLTLRDLRNQGGTERGIPAGGVFSIVPVTCPNYFFEILAWVGMWMINWSLSTLVFIVIAAGQMAVWARKKESRYRKEFGDKYKRKRFAMIPGIV